MYNKRDKSTQREPREGFSQRDARGYSSWTLFKGHDGIVAEYAYKILVEQLYEIRNVNEWADLAGCSRRWLGRCIKNHFGKTPQRMLREERYKKIRSVLEQNPDALAYDVAKQVAQHWTDKHLCNFLSGYDNTNFTKLRYEVLTGGQKTAG